MVKRLVNGRRPFSVLAKILGIDAGCFVCLDMMSNDLSWPEQDLTDERRLREAGKFGMAGGIVRRRQRIDERRL